MRGPMPEKDFTAERANQRNAVIACFLGWTLDAFDFFILTFVLAPIAKDFHKSIPQMALAITASLATRPIGAFVFGLLADRYGRRWPLMRDVFHRRLAGAADAVHSRESEGERGVEGDVGAYGLGCILSFDFPELETIRVSGAAYGADEFYFPRHAGFLSDVSAIAARLQPAHDGADYRAFTDRRDCGRNARRTVFRPPWAAARDVWRGDSGRGADSAVDRCTEFSADFAGRVPDAIHGAGRVGGDSRAHQRAFARHAARIFPGACVSTGRAVCGVERLSRGHHGETDELRARDGDFRGDGADRWRGGDCVGTGSTRNCIWGNENRRHSFNSLIRRPTGLALVSTLGLNRVKSNREFLIRRNRERDIESSTVIIHDRYHSRKGTPPGDFVHDGDDRGGIGASDVLFIRRGAYGWRVFLRYEIGSEKSKRHGERSVCAFKGTCCTIALCGTGRGGRVSRFARDDAAAIFERTRRPPDAAHSWSGRSDGIPGTRAFGGSWTRDWRENGQDRDARIRAARRWRVGGGQQLGSGGIRGALRNR